MNIKLDARYGNYFSHYLYPGQLLRFNNFANEQFTEMYFVEYPGIALKTVECKPVLLTHEILDMMDFEIISNKYYKEWFPFALSYYNEINDDGEMESHWELYQHHILFRVKILYLHQLQNIASCFGVHLHDLKIVDNV